MKEVYWESGSKIPQILVSDDFTQNAYGVSWAPGTGVLLVSYTWEDDAVKVLAEDGQELAHLMLEKLDEITKSTVGEKISDYLNLSNDSATVIHWARQPTYRGCAKLYRPRNWDLNYALLSYNQRISNNSRVYFAGENYGAEGGWTEPALRLAIDAVIHIVQNSGGTFNNGFNPDSDYPKYDVNFGPDFKYPSPHFRS